MIYSAANAINEDVNQLRSLMQQLGSVWNDKVSEYVSDSLLTAVISHCNTFASDVSAFAMMVRQEEETLNSLLCG